MTHDSLRISSVVDTGYETSAYLFNEAFAVELVAAGEGVERLRHQGEGTAGTLILRLDECVSGEENNMLNHVHEEYYKWRYCDCRTIPE